MIKILFVFTLLCNFCVLVANEKKVEFFVNYNVDTNYLTEILKNHEYPATVEFSNLSSYGRALKKDKGKIRKWLRAINMLPVKKIPVHEDVQKIVFWNITGRFIRRLDLSKLPKEKLVLFMWEPPTILPKLYHWAVHKCFSKIYTWNDDLVDNQTYFKFNYPALKPMLAELPSFEQKKLCTLISSNATSKYPHELYSERRKAIAFFETKDNEFDFYGRLWDPKLYKNYRGWIENKIGTLKNYRFSICYENSSDLRGYITEKIFDCFHAGNVPVYWGAPNVLDYIPKDCFIDRRDFQDLEQLYQFLKNMSKEEYEDYLKRIREYLKSPKAQQFSQEHFQKIFVEAVAS